MKLLVAAGNGWSRLANSLTIRLGTLAAGASVSSWTRELVDS